MLPESREAVGALHKQGIKVAMISGDAEQMAKAVAGDLGIEAVFAEVLPEDKAVTELHKPGHTVAAGTAAFLLASHGDDLATIGVLASLYPAVTVLLAATVLREPFRLSQGLGLLVCGASVGLVAMG